MIAVLAMAACATSYPARAEPPAVVAEPVAGRAYQAWPWDLAAQGYTEEEYFVSGTAAPFDPGGAVTMSLVAGSGQPEPFTTRLRVLRPSDPARFSGTVIVEWMNVSGQFDMATQWIWGHPYLMDAGHAYVGVTAQEVGVCGDKEPVLPLELCAPTSVKGYDPGRYAALHHPGDMYAFDIFSQAVESLVSAAPSPLGPLAPETVIAVGESQSALWLDRYLCNGADAAAHVIDAYLSDADVGTALACTPRVPTVQFWSEDSAQRVSSTAHDNHRIWMVPGAPHGDRWLVQFVAQTALSDLGVQPAISLVEAEEAAGTYGELGTLATPDQLACAPGGSMFPRRYATDAALAALERWARTGEAAPTIPPMEFVDGTDLPTVLNTQIEFRRDVHGNSVGGLRSPVLDVPVAMYLGTTCALLGLTASFPEPVLARLYTSHADYVAQLHAAAERAVAEGTLLPLDAEDLMRRACAAPILGGPAPGHACPPITSVSPYEPRRMTHEAPSDPTPDETGAPPAVGAPSTTAPSSLPATGGAPSPAAPVLYLVAAYAMWALSRRRRSRA